MFVLTLAEDDNFEEGTGTSGVDVAVAKGEVLDCFVYRKTFREHLHALGAEIVVVEFEDLQRCVGFGVHQVTDELTAKRCELVVKQVQLKDCFDLLEALTDSAASLIFTEGLPKTHCLSVGVTIRELARSIKLT
jgi:hypothetical protein